MNKQIYLIILLLTCRICSAQNLVPNGDFEQISGCPNLHNQLNLALFWINPTGTTPDYFNQCGTSYAGVPYNAGGFQNALSGGGYAGIMLKYGASVGFNWREYLETQLITPLVAGNCYYFEMHINLCDNSAYSISNIGVYFSDTLINDSTNTNLLSLTPQIINTNSAFPDTTNWYQVSGTYTALGGETYIVIGNFDDDVNTPFIVYNPNGFVYSYVYVENVQLYSCTSVNENTAKTVVVYPNPISDWLTISVGNNIPSEIIICDIVSRITLQQKFTSSVSLNTEQLAKGIYIYEVRNKNGVVKKGKVVKD